MIYILLAWLLPFVLVLVLVYLLEDHDMTVRDLLQVVGMSLIPLLNWVILYMLVVEVIKENEKIQEFLNKKLR